MSPPSPFTHGHWGRATTRRICIQRSGGSRFLCHTIRLYATPNNTHARKHHTSPKFSQSQSLSTVTDLDDALAVLSHSSTLDDHLAVRRLPSVMPIFVPRIAIPSSPFLGDPSLVCFLFLFGQGAVYPRAVSAMGLFDVGPIFI